MCTSLKVSKLRTFVTVHHTCRLVSVVVSDHFQLVNTALLPPVDHLGDKVGHRQDPDREADEHEGFSVAHELYHHRGQNWAKNRSNGKRSCVDRRDAGLQSLFVFFSKFPPTHSTILFELRVKHGCHGVIVYKSAAYARQDTPGTDEV